MARSNTLTARSLPLTARSHPQTRLDFLIARSNPLTARSHPQIRLDLIKKNYQPIDQEWIYKTLINHFDYFYYISQQSAVRLTVSQKETDIKSRSHRPRPRKLTKNLNLLLTRARRKLYAFLEFLNIIIARYWILTLAPLAPGPHRHQREHPKNIIVPLHGFCSYYCTRWYYSWRTKIIKPEGTHM